MFKTFVKDVVARKAMVLLSDSLLGRALLKKGVSMVSHQIGIPLDVQPDIAAPDFWHISAGSPSSDLCLHVRARRETLAEMIEFAANAWLEDRKLTIHDILPFLVRHMNKPAPGATDSLLKP